MILYAIDQIPVFLMMRNCNNLLYLVLTGRIAAPTGPLVIGRCSDKDAFYGYIDMVGIIYFNFEQ